MRLGKSSPTQDFAWVLFILEVLNMVAARCFSTLGNASGIGDRMLARYISTDLKSIGQETSSEGLDFFTSHISFQSELRWSVSDGCQLS